MTRDPVPLLQMLVILLVFAGALFLSAAVARGRRTTPDIPQELSRRWSLITGLMVFCLAGYLVFTVIVIGGVRLAEEVVTGAVFLGGAILVYIVIDLTARTIRRAKMAEEELRALAESLEQRVADRTQALRRSHEFLKTVLDSLNDAVCIIDVQDRRILGANAAFLAEHRLQEQDIVGKTCHEVTHGRREVCALPDDCCPLREMKQTGAAAVAEHIHRTGDGGTMHVEVSVYPIRDAQGTITQAVHVSRDITERKEAERKLRRSAEELAHSNEELKNFLYIVSHDLRVPLVNIKGFSEELRKSIDTLNGILGTVAGRLDETGQRTVRAALHQEIPEAVQFIQSSVSRIDSLLNSLLKLSRIGRRELSFDRVDMNEVVSQALASLAHRIEESGTTVTVGTLPYAHADRTAMDQIVTNLLDNAVKYLQPGRPGRIEVWGETAGSEAIFHVRDNGRGMAKEEIPRAFEIFRRVGVQNVPGEGMGLAYAKTLVLRHGGRIWCESEQGRGSTFSFTIPMTAPQQRTGTAAPERISSS